MEEVLSFREAKKLARRAEKLHREERELRKEILTVLRSNLKSNIRILAYSKNSDIRWMVHKYRSGYFGTDIRTTQLVKMVTALEQATTKKGLAECIAERIKRGKENQT